MSYDNYYFVTSPSIAVVDFAELVIAPALNGGVFAVRATTGEPVWMRYVSQTYTLNDAIRGSAAVLSNGTDVLVVVITWGGRVAAVDAQTGVIRWTYESGGYVDAAPAIGLDGTIYYGDSQGRLSALEPNASNASLTWRMSVGGPVVAAAAVDATGNVIVGTDNGNGLSGFLVCITSGANVTWNQTLDGGVRGAPAISGDGTVFVVTTSRKLYGFRTSSGSPAFTPRHLTDGGSFGDRGPSIDSAGYVHLITTDGLLRMIYPDTGLTHISRMVDPSAAGMTTLVHGWDGLAYSADSSGRLLALEVGEIVWRYQAFGGFGNGPAMGRDGTLYILGGSIHAVGEPMPPSPTRSATATSTAQAAAVSASASASATMSPSATTLTSTGVTGSPTASPVVQVFSPSIAATSGSTSSWIATITPTATGTASVSASASATTTTSSRVASITDYGVSDTPTTSVVVSAVPPSISGTSSAVASQTTSRSSTPIFAEPASPMHSSTPSLPSATPFPASPSQRPLPTASDDASGTPTGPFTFPPSQTLSPSMTRTASVTASMTETSAGNASIPEVNMLSEVVSAPLLAGSATGGLLALVALTCCSLVCLAAYRRFTRKRREHQVALRAYQLRPKAYALPSCSSEVTKLSAVITSCVMDGLAGRQQPASGAGHTPSSVNLLTEKATRQLPRVRQDTVQCLVNIAIDVHGSAARHVSAAGHRATLLRVPEDGTLRVIVESAVREAATRAEECMLLEVSETGASVAPHGEGDSIEHRGNGQAAARARALAPGETGRVELVAGQMRTRAMRAAVDLPKRLMPPPAPPSFVVCMLEELRWWFAPRAPPPAVTTLRAPPPTGADVAQNPRDTPTTGRKAVPAIELVAPAVRKRLTATGDVATVQHNVVRVQREMASDTTQKNRLSVRPLSVRKDGSFAADRAILLKGYAASNGPAPAVVVRPAVRAAKSTVV